MNDYSIQYEVNLSYPKPADDRWLVAGEFDAWPLGQRNGAEYLVRRRDGQAMAILKHEVMLALGLCDRLRPSEDQIDRIGERLPHLQAHRDTIRQALSALQQQGLLMSADEFMRPLRQSSPHAIETPFDSLYIRTCGRRQALTRLLDQLAVEPHRSNPLSRYVVIDDSPDPDSRRFVRDLVKTRRAATGLPLIYFGPADRQRFTQWLARQLALDAETLGWLWLDDAGDTEPGYGTGLNLALALTAGKRFAVIDDDAIPIPYAAPVPDRAICFSSEDPAVRCYLDPIWQKQQPLSLDPIRGHGENLGEVVSRYCPASRSADQLFQALERKDLYRLRSDSSVRITVNGLYGDPGTAGMAWVFHTDHDGQADLIRDAATYRERLSRRQVWKGRGTPTLSPVNSRALMTTTLTGIDNATLVLPTLPRGRQEDTVLGTLMAVLYPQALQLELPWALPHVPEETRSWNPDLLDQPQSLSVNGYLAEHLYAAGTGKLSADPETVVLSMSAKLRDLAAGGNGLRMDLERSLLALRSIRVQSLQSRLMQHPDAPDFWRRDVERLIAADTGLRSEDHGVLESQVALIRHRAARFAAALELWPAVWSLCRDMGEQALLERVTREEGVDPEQPTVDRSA